MKKICIDARMVFSSGIGTYLRNLLPFIEKKYQLILLGNKRELALLGLKNTSIIPFDSPIYSIKELFQLPFLIPKCDLFWSPHYNIPIFPIKARKRVTTIHDVFHLKFSDTLPFYQKLYARLFLNAAITLSDSIITVSEFSKNEIIKYLNANKQKIQVVYNGVGKTFKVIENEFYKKNIQSLYSLPDHYILFVGNIKPHKNLTNLIKAFALLKKGELYNNYKLVVVGKRKGLITQTKNLDKLINVLELSSEIIFLENIKPEELPAVYNLAKLLVFPSFYEGFGLPPLEAMSCGCPVIASDIECLREIYQESCLYISPEKPESIEDGIISVLTDEKKMGNLVRKGNECAKKYNWDSAANHHLDIFETILEQD